MSVAVRDAALGAAKGDEDFILALNAASTPGVGDMDAQEMLNRALALAGSGRALTVHPLLGNLPEAYSMPQSLATSPMPARSRQRWRRMPAAPRG